MTEVSSLLWGIFVLRHWTFIHWLNEETEVLTDFKEKYLLIVLLFAACLEQVWVFNLAAWLQSCSLQTPHRLGQSQARIAPGDQWTPRQGGTLNCSLESVPCSAAFRACSQLRHAPRLGLWLASGPAYRPLIGWGPDIDRHHDITIWTRGMSAGIIPKFSRWNENRERLR